MVATVVGSYLFIMATSPGPICNLVQNDLDKATTCLSIMVKTKCWSHGDQLDRLHCTAIAHECSIHGK